MFLNKPCLYIYLLSAFLIVSLFSCTSSTEKSYEIRSRGRFTMDQFIGANAFVDDPIDKLKAVGFIREYHNWEWNDAGIGYAGYPYNKIKWDHENWNFDSFYKSVKESTLDISPCIQDNVQWLHKSSMKFSDKPVDEATSNTTDPASYQKKSHFMYQFAARYGSATVADKKLTLADNQPRKSGMKLIRYLEDWNEQNKGWEGKNAEFSAEEYAAMASADYDGHCRTMNMGSGTFGIKNADPDMKFVMGGLAGLELGYIKRMKTWFEKNRADKKFAADVLNFHVYGWKHDEGWTGGGPPKSPEASNFKERLEKITEYRDKHLPGLEVWVSEFGWDTNPGSPLCAPAIGGYDIQEVQAQWLVRSYLAFAAAGVDRAQMFMLRDVDSKSAIWYSSCGLVGPKGNWKPKKSWFYVYTLKNTLKNMVYEGEEPSGNEKILIYKFKEPQTQKHIYTVWANTSSGYIAKGYKLKVKEKFSTATKTEFLTGKTEGITSNLKFRNNEFLLDVSERPVFIKIE